MRLASNSSCLKLREALFYFSCIGPSAKFQGRKPHRRTQQLLESILKLLGFL